MRFHFKKIIACLLAVCLTCSAFAGCGKNSGEESGNTAPGKGEKPQETRYITFAGHEYPINEKVPANEYDASLFRVDGSYARYGDHSLLGVDVSSFQDEIDWGEVKASGVDFVMVRVGYRGHTEGLLHEDNRFRENMANAYKAGMKIGVYFFGQAITLDEVAEEADYVLDLIEPYRDTITLPVVYDWEHAAWDTRTVGTDPEKIVDIMNYFCNRMEDAGYRSMLYINNWMAYQELDIVKIQHRDWWLAEWFVDDGNPAPTFYYKYEMLQYSSRGSVPGIPAEVDMNILFEDYTEEP